MNTPPPSQKTGNAFTISWKLLAGQFLLLVVCSGLGVVALKKMGADLSWETLTKNLTLAAVALPALAYAFAWVVEGFRNWLLFKYMGETIACREVVLGFVVGLFMAHITPFTAGGAPLQMAYFALLGVSTGRSGAVFAIGGVFAQLTLSLGVVVFLWWVGETSLILAPGLYLLAMVAILVVVFVSGTRLKEQPAIKGAKGRLVSHMLESLRDIPPAMGTLLRIPVPITLVVLLLTWLYHLIFMLTAPLLFLLLHHQEPQWVEFTARAGVVLLLVSLSPTPGGAGAAEALSAKFLDPMLQGQMNVGDFTLLWRTVTFHWATLAGFVAFLFMMRHATKLLAQHHEDVEPLEASSG